MTVLSQRSWLFQLPHELLLMILLECSPSALLRCRQTCRRMNDIVQLSAELQYKLYLAFYGYVDNPSCRRSYARKFEKLCRTEQRWYRLQEESQLKIPAPLEVESDFDNGIYVHAPGPGDDPELLRVVQLPPNHDGSPLTNHVEWTIRVPGIPLTGFVIDAEQDLLIIPEKCNIHDSYSLHFLTLSTGAPHPMACAPCLRVPGVTTRTAIGNSVPFDPHCSITIRQNLIIFRSLVNRSSDDSPCPIQVIDWHLGVLNLSLNSSHYRSLAFLNDHTFLTIYRAPSSPVWSLILFETNDKYPGIPFIKGVLSMPPLSLEGDLVMKVHTGASGVPSHSQTSKSKCPPPTWSACSSSSYSQPNVDGVTTHRITRRKHFVPADESSLVVVSVHSTSPNVDFVGVVRMCMLSSTLLHYARILNGSTLPWELWGPNNTRCLSSWDEASPRHLHGLRLVSQYYSDLMPPVDPDPLFSYYDPLDASTQIFYDFNPYPIKATKLNYTTFKHRGWTVYTQESCLQLSTFQIPIVSRLPFRWRMSGKCTLTNGVMFDGDNLVVHNADFGGEGDIWINPFLQVVSLRAV